MNKGRILLPSLLEEVLQMDCNNFAGKGGCFSAEEGKQTKRKETERQETQSFVLLEDILTCFPEHRRALKALGLGEAKTIFLSFEGSPSL